MGETLGLVTCYFNPCGYQNLKRNYWEFRKRLGREITTVELSFDGQFEIADAIQIQGTDKNLLWQKERLLNIGIDSLPDSIDLIAWLDCDILFGNRWWFEQTIEQLQVHSVVQLFERVHWLDQSGQSQMSWQSFASALRKVNPSGGKGHTGFAWAARREFIPNGLFDADQSGQADQRMADYWSGSGEQLNTKQSGQRNSAFSEWSRSIPDEQSQMGSVQGTISHLFHGDLIHRRYESRNHLLSQNQFDPNEHLSLDHLGLYRWSSNAPSQLINFYRDYFSLRREDGKIV